MTSDELDIEYDNIFTKMNNAFWEGDFKSVNDEFINFELTKDNWELAVAMLCYSKIAKRYLPNRKIFHDQFIKLGQEMGGYNLIQSYAYLE